MPVEMCGQRDAGGWRQPFVMGCGGIFPADVMRCLIPWFKKCQANVIDAQSPNTVVAEYHHHIWNI